MLNAQEFIFKHGVLHIQRLYEISEDRSIQQQDEFELERGEDAPMSMAAHAEVCTQLPEFDLARGDTSKTSTVVCGINNPETQLANGLNENCRAYNVKENKYAGQSSSGSRSHLFN